MLRTPMRLRLARKITTPWIPLWLAANSTLTYSRFDFSNWGSDFETSGVDCKPQWNPQRGKKNHSSHVTLKA